MATDLGKPQNDREMKRSTEKEFEVEEREFESLVFENIPGWTAIWNILLQGSEERRKERGSTSPMDLQKKIRWKISELLDEEETLVDLYRKAAEEAKRKEEEFNGKTAILIRQIEKDKNLMKTLKQIN